MCDFFLIRTKYRVFFIYELTNEQVNEWKKNENKV